MKSIELIDVYSCLVRTTKEGKGDLQKSNIMTFLTTEVSLGGRKRDIHVWAYIQAMDINITQVFGIVIFIGYLNLEI